MAETEKNGSICLSWVTTFPLHFLKTVAMYSEDMATGLWGQGEVGVDKTQELI